MHIKKYKLIPENTGKQNNTINILKLLQNIFQFQNNIYKIPANFTLTDKIINAFPLKLGSRKICLLSPILLILLEITDHVQQVKEIKG